MTKLDEMIEEFHDNWCATGSYIGNDTTQKQFHEQELRKFAAEILAEIIPKKIKSTTNEKSIPVTEPYRLGYNSAIYKAIEKARSLGVEVE